MATSLLAVGTTAASSSPVTLASGESVTVFITSALGPVSEDSPVTLEFQNSTSTWTPVAVLSSKQIAVTFTGPTIFRVTRALSTIAVGVDRA